MTSNFDVVLNLKLPAGKSAFVGRDCGEIERDRLRLDLLDSSVDFVAKRPHICLCTRGLGNGIITLPYLEGLLGGSVRFWGPTEFMAIYRVQKSPSRQLSTLTINDLYRLTLHVHETAET